MIVNKTKGRGTFGQPNGHFSVYVNPDDLISISVKGYHIINYKIRKTKNVEMKKYLFLNQRSKNLEML